MADLRVPIRQQGSGLPTLGFIPVPVEGNPKDPASSGDLTRLRIGKQIWDVGAGGDDAYDWATVGHDDERVPPAKLGTGSPGATVFLRGDGVWAAPPSGGMGSATWLGLSDTPASWGTEGQYPAVNQDTNALEWATPLVTHYDGDGAPATAPAVSGALSVDDAGKVFPAVTQHITHTTAPTMTSETEAQFTPAVYWRGVNAVIGSTSGNFTRYTASRQFVQRRDNTNHPVSWASAWQYIEGRDPTVDLRQSIFLGQFDTEAEALAAFNANATAIARYTDGTTITDANSAYWIDTSANVLKRVTAYTASSTTVTEALHWGERLASFGDLAREHWRGEWEINVSRAKAGDLWYVEREDFNMNVEKVVWLAVSDTATAPTIGFDRFWINLTDTDHYRGEAFEHVLSNDVAIFFEHGDTFLYDDKLYFAFHESDLSINDILNETARYTDHFKLLTPTIPSPGDDAYDWATEGNTSLIPAAKLPALTAETLDTLIETPGPFGLSHVVNTTPDPHTLNLGLSTATIARLVDTMGTAGQVYTRTAGGHEWANLAVFDWAKTGDASQIPVAKLGTGSPSSSNYLRGDGSWAAVSTGATTFLGLSDTPGSYGPFWNIPAVNTARNALFWIAGPVGWAQRGDSQQIPLAKLGTGTADATRFLRGDGAWQAVPLDPRLVYYDQGTGAVRAATADDWDGANMLSKLWAWDGSEFEKAVEVPATGTLTEVPENTPFADSLAPGTNYRWRGAHNADGDVSGPAHLDFYFRLSDNAVRAYASAGFGNFHWVTHGAASYEAYIDLHGRVADEAAALAAATGNGQHFVYETATPGAYALYRLSNFVAKSYDWQPVYPAADDAYDWATVGNAALVPTDKLGTGTASSGTYLRGDGMWSPLSDVGTRIVFPDDMGALRPGVADDWDAPNALSKVFAWTGNHLQRINRVPVPKSATFTPVPDGTNLGGTTDPRWRTFHHNDGQVTSPQDNDLYYNLTNNVFRFRQGGNWSNLSADHFAITGAGIVSGTVFADQPTALDSSSLTANGQRVMYAEAGGHFLSTVSDFVAAHNAYPWQNVYADWVQSESTEIIPQVRLGTGMASSSTFLRGDGSWATPPSGGGSGTDQAFTNASYTFSVPLSSGTIRFTRDSGDTFDLVMLMPFVSAQAVRDGIVEPWATRGESDRVPLAKLEGPVTSLTNWTFDAATRRQSLSVNRINETNVTIQGPVFPEWITAASVADWAEATNTDDVPTGKLGTGTADDTTWLRGDGSWQSLPASFVTSRVSSWALVGDTSIIPTSKLPSFIRPVYDWAAAGDTSVIPVGKLGSGATSTAVFLRGDGTWATPTGGGGSDQIHVVANSDIAYSDNGNRRRVNLTISGASSSVGTMVLFQYADSDFTPDTAEIEVGVNGSGFVRIKWDNPIGGSLENITLGDVTRYNYYLLIRAGSFWHKIGGTVEAIGPAGLSLSDVDARIATWARAFSPTGNAPPARLAGGFADGRVLMGISSTTAGWAVPPWLTQAQVDARVQAGVHDWAEAANTTIIPTTKLGTGGAANRWLAWDSSGTAAWLELPSGGQYPGDDHVRDLIGATGSFLTHPADVSRRLGVDYNATTHRLELSTQGRTENEVNAQIEARRDLEWCSATVTATSTAVTIALDGEGNAAVSTERILAINYISTFPATRPDSLPVFMTYNGMSSGNVQLFGANNARRNMTLGDLRVYGHTNVPHLFRRRSGGWDWMGTAGAASVAQDLASLVYSWARTGNNDALPASKIPGLDASKTTSGAFHTDRLANAVTAARINAVVDGSPGNNRVIGYDTSDAGLKWYDLPSGGGGGDDAFDWATVGNTDTIPDAKIPGLAASKTTSGTFDVARIPDLSASKTTSGVFAVARLGSGSPSSTTFLRGDGSWATPPSGGTSTPDLYKVANSDISYSTSGSRRRVNLTISGADNSVGTLVLFQWSDATLTPASNEVEVGVNGSSYVRIKWDNPVGGSLENITLDDITRYNYYLLYRAGSFWHKIGGTVEALGSGGTGLTEAQVRALIADWAEEGNLVNIPVTKLGNVSSWARVGDANRIPEAKMTGYPTSFSLTAAGAQTFQWQMQRQGLANLSAGSVLIPGLPSTITGSLSGTDLTLSMTRTGTGGTITSSAIDLSGLGGGGGGLTAEQARDTIAAFAVPGTGISITHDDPGDRLIFSADPHFEQVQTLVVFDHTGNAFRLNRDRPSDLFQVGTNVPGTSSGATYHRPDRRVYVITTTGNIQRSAVNALSGWTSVGTLPSGRGAYNALASDGTDIYALSEDGLTQVDLSNVGTSTYLGDWPTGLFGIGGATFHLDVLHLVSASTRKIHVVSDLSSPGTAADRGRLPTGFVGVPHQLVAAGGRLYTMEAHTNGIELWEVNPISPGSSSELGNVRGQGATITAGAAIDVRLDTTYIPEGTGLYYTNARVDSRVSGYLNPSSAATAFLEDFAVSGTTYQVRNTYEIDRPGDLPAPSAQTLGQAYFAKSTRQLFVGIDDPHTQNTPSGTFNAISARTDLHVVTAFPSDQNALTAGDFYYLHGQGWNDGFYVVAVRYGVNELVNSSPTDALADSRSGTSQGVVFLGAEYSSTDALRFTHSVASGTDYFWLDLGASPPTFKRLDNSTFTAAGGTTHHYQFWAVGGSLPAGNPGQYLKLDSNRNPEFASIPTFFDWARTGNTDLVPTSKLGSGTGSSSTWLRGDGSWQSIPSGSPQILLDPDATPMASYWDATDSLSSRLKWTGFGFQRIKRELTGQHGASATFTEVANNTTFTQGGVTYRWKGAHQYDSNVSASVNDFFFKWSTGKFRVFRDGPNFSRDFWEDIPGRDIIPTYVDDYGSQSDALSHVGANGQYVIYTTSGVDKLYRVSNFVAASSGTPTYTWEDWVPWAGGLTEGDVLGLMQDWAEAGNTSAVPVSKGGTGATTASGALSNLGALGSVAHDNTLTGDGTSSSPLAVSINDVTETLQESIQHFTSGALSYSNKGASIGHRYGSGPYKTEISRVTVSIDAPNSGGTYVARLYTLQDNNRIDTHLANSNTRTLSHRRNESFDFTAGSHMIPTNSRIGVLISRTDDGNGGDVRLRVGSETSSSPTESYDDASVDFERIGWVEYEHTNPPSNQSTHTHDTDGTADVYGDMRIQYRRIFDHGNFVSDGNVDASHIDSDGAAAGNALFADGSDGTQWIAAARLGESNTFTEPQTIDVDEGNGLTVNASDYSGGSPVMRLVTSASDSRSRAFEFFRGSDSQAFFSAAFGAGPSSIRKPGIELGAGGSTARDVILYRDAANVWRTPDAFHVGELRLDVGGQSASRTQLGLGSAATRNSGDAAGNVVVLNNDARINTDKLGSDVGSTPGSKVLYDDGSFKDAPSGGVGNLTFFSLASDLSLTTSYQTVGSALTITPASTDAVIGILLSIGATQSSSGAAGVQLEMRRGSTALTPQMIGQEQQRWGRQLFLDKPSSTSQQSYTAQARRVGSASRSVFIGTSLAVFAMPAGVVADVLSSDESAADDDDFLSVTITPSSTSAIIKLNMLLLTTQSPFNFTVRRGSTDLRAIAGAGGGHLLTNVADFPSNFEDHYDQPNTTNAVTYHIRNTQGATRTARKGSYLMAQEVA